MSTLQFWKPGTAGPGSSLDRATETEENVVGSAPTSGAVSIQAARERLPIYKHSECSLWFGAFAWLNSWVFQRRSCCIALRNMEWLYLLARQGVARRRVRMEMSSDDGRGLDIPRIRVATVLV